MSFLSNFSVPYPESKENKGTQNNSLAAAVPTNFLQLVHKEDQPSFIHCLRIVRADHTQAPIVQLRMVPNLSVFQSKDKNWTYLLVQVSKLRSP